MARRDRWLTSRRVVVASVIFGLFVLFDIGLFAWLIFDTLSQREIEEVLLETRQQAEPIAEDLAARAREQDSEDLFVVVTVARETQTYIDSVLSGRELVRSVEIRNAEGTVVYQKSADETAPLDTGDDLPSLEVPRMDSLGPEALLETEVPIGDGLGTLVIGLSEAQVQERIGVLRSELTRQASIIGGLTLFLLAAASYALLRLFQRARTFESQAQEAERMAYVGTLASGLAHEIRSPLNSLSLNMQMLEEETKGEVAGHRAGDSGKVGGGGTGGASASSLRLLEITRSEIGRLERLASDFLTYAKPRSVELEKIPMVELLYRARDVLAAEVRARRVELEVEDETGGAEIEVDPGQVKQMLLNLIQNALGALEGIKGPRQIRLVARRKGGRKVLEVSDTGSGIPEDVRDHVFDLFYSRRKGGTGLGLAIVQRIAQIHGADVELDTETGAGTTIRILFP